VDDQRGFVLERIRLKLVGHFAESVLDKSLLQHRLFAMRPGSQHGLHDRDRVPIVVGGLLVRDCLRQTPELIKAFRPAAPVDSGIAGDEWSQIGAAVSLFFHCFATVCCGGVQATVRQSGQGLSSI
jgi:hypothetical protein